MRVVFDEIGLMSLSCRQKKREREGMVREINGKSFPNELGVGVF